MKKKLLSLGLAIIISVSAFIPTISFADNRDLNVIRISGGDRYKTAVNASKETFDESEYAIVASGEGFADALVGGTLATQIKAPIFLTKKNTISKDVLNEIERLGVEKVFLLGGIGSVSKSVENQLKSLGITIKRLSGANREETAYAIVHERFILTGEEIWGDAVAVINGYDFADALSAAPFVGQYTRDVSPGFVTLHPHTTKNLPPPMVIGGYNSVPYVDYEGIRLKGNNRFDTAVKVARAYKTELKKDLNTVVLVDGYNYPDALASAPIASMNNGAILLTDPKLLSKETKDFIRDNENIENVIIVGGNNSVSSNVEKELKNIASIPSEQIEGKFDGLDKGLQTFLISNIIESRIEEYRNLNYMEFYYTLVGNDLYTQLHSGAGSGHPIYHFVIEDDTVTYVDGYVQAGWEDYYKLYYPMKTVQKNDLYKEYLNYKGEYDIAAKKIKNSDIPLKQYNYIENIVN